MPICNVMHFPKTVQGSLLKKKKSLYCLHTCLFCTLQIAVFPSCYLHLSGIIDYLFILARVIVWDKLGSK